jgi:hypothetical protein
MEWWWKSVCIGAFVATAAFAQPQPEIRVRVWCGANYQDTHHWAGDPIDINVGEWVGCPDHVNIWDRSGSPTHDIGPVYLYGSRASPITITISSGAWRGLDNTRHAAATSGSWAGITVANGMDDLVYLEGRVGGDLTGLVRVGEIYRLDIDGQIQAGIQADHAGLGPFWLYGGSMSTSGNANSPNDSIARVEMRSGNLAGSVSAGGNIGDIVVAGDLLAGNNNPDIYSGGRITKIEVGGKIGDAAANNQPVIVATSGIGTPYSGIIADSIHADITTDDGNSIDNALWYLETRDGNLSGSITARYINRHDPDQQYYGMIVNGDIDATIDITQNCDGRIRATGVLTQDAVIRIARDLNALAKIELAYGSGVDLDALKGQVIINAEDGIGLWENDVVVDGTTLSWGVNDDPGEYTQTAASLGGGAVGLVPFSTHRESCSPVHGIVKSGAPASITLQFYGPVVQQSVGTDMPVRVYRGDFGTGEHEVDVTGDFAVDMHPGGDRRKVRIVPDTKQFKPKYRYRLAPITAGAGTGETLLLCDDLLAAGAVPVKGRDYWVDVNIAMATLDLGGNGWVDSPDVVLWVASPEDFNGDSAADSTDLQMVVDNLGEPVD